MQVSYSCHLTSLFNSSLKFRVMTDRICLSCDPTKTQSYDLCNTTTGSSYCSDTLVVELGGTVSSSAAGFSSIPNVPVKSICYSLIRSNTSISKLNLFCVKCTDYFKTL